MRDLDENDEKWLKKPTQEGNEFRGLFIPVGICEAVESGEISTTEAFVYGIVEVLNGKFGCYATNSYLAKRCNMSERNLRRYLSSLIDKGFIDIFESDIYRSGRILKTFYREKRNEKAKKRRKS